MTDEQNKTLRDLLLCFMSWEPQVRVLGNVRADDAADAIRTALLAAGASEGQEPNPACSLSWSGFNVHGDDKSIREVRHIVNVAGRCVQLEAEIAALRERIYQVWANDDRDTWIDVEADDYRVRVPSERRIVYAAKEPQP